MHLAGYVSLPACLSSKQRPPAHCSFEALGCLVVCSSSDQVRLQWPAPQLADWIYHACRSHSIGTYHRACSTSAHLLLLLLLLLQGKHTLNVKVTLIKSSAEVNSVASLQPSTDQLFSSKVNFNLVEKLPAGAAAAEAPAAAAATAAADEPAAPAAADKPATPAAVTKAEPAAVPAPKPDTSSKNVTNALADNPEADAAIDETVTQQAVKYYCMRQYNVGGKIHSQKEVPVGDEGVMACSVACNALGSNSGGFGLTGKKCFLMTAFNTNSSAADATIDALCMKSPNDWLDFGVRNGE